MRKLFLKNILLGTLVLLSVLSSCEDADYDILGVHAYVSESTKGESSKIIIGDEGADISVTACLSEAIEEDVEFKFVIDPSILADYNEAQSTSFVPLPEGAFDMDSKVVIKAGEFSAPATKIHINAFSDEMLGESYALPLRLVSVDGKIPTTVKTATYVFTTEAIFSYSLPMFKGAAELQVKLSDTGETYGQFTVEVKFQVSDTNNRDRALFKNYVTEGDDQNFVLLRFEDPQNDQNGVAAHSWVQVVGRNRIYCNPFIAFVPNKWQHLALTCDGKSYRLYVNGTFAGTINIPAGPTTFKNISWFSSGDGGPSFWGSCKILLTEARIWSVCRTEAQIANNMSIVSPKSKGLEGYWKFNEGSGNVFEDCTGHGHTITTSKTPYWISNIKSNDTLTEWPEE